MYHFTHTNVLRLDTRYSYLLFFHLCFVYADVQNNKGKAIAYKHTSEQHHEIDTRHQPLATSMSSIENDKMHVHKPLDKSVWNNSPSLLLYTKGNLEI